MATNGLISIAKTRKQAISQANLMTHIDRATKPLF